MLKWQKIVLFLLLSATLIGCDRVTKDLAKTHLLHQHPITYFNGRFRLMYVENTGAALSLGDRLSKTSSFWLLSILPLACLLGLLIYTVRRSGEITPAKIICLALIFAGGIGNIIDRIAYDRHVTDFINIRIPILDTGIFNLADVYITTGVLALLISTITRSRTSANPPTA